MVKVASITNIIKGLKPRQQKTMKRRKTSGKKKKKKRTKR